MILQARCVPRHGRDGAGRRAETLSPGVRGINACGMEPAPLTSTTCHCSGSRLRRCTQHPCSDGCVRNSCKVELSAPARLLRDTSGLEVGQGTSLKACSTPERLQATAWDGLGARGSSCTLCCQNRSATRCPSALLLQPYLYPSLVLGLHPREWDPTGAGSLGRAIPKSSGLRQESRGCGILHTHQSQP